MTATLLDGQTAHPKHLKTAVHQHRALTAKGTLERLFTLAFSGLVYPLIWEDPLVDLEAMEVAPQHRIVTIASGGCNVLSYLVTKPASIAAVDLNRAHVALTRLKLAAVRHLPSYELFHRFFAEADSAANAHLYDAFLSPRLDAATRRYWEGRNLMGRRRIEMFCRDFYHYGLLGRFIGLAHRVARLYGIDPAGLLHARTPEEQADLFEQLLQPIFEKRLVRWLTGRRLSLYGLGIPPAQYDKLADGRSMAEVLAERLRKLACDFPLDGNYFAWQAFGRGYGEGPGAPLPPYLQRENFESLRDGSRHVETELGSLTAHLHRAPAESIDRFVLLDAQDWMSDAQLNELWTEIGRTARAGARVIFRTAGEASILPGRLSPALMDGWRYEEGRSRALGAKDRSAIYGGFHLYRLR